CDTRAFGGQAGASARIENYLGFPTGISGLALTARAYNQAQKFGADIMIPMTVESLDCTRSDGAFSVAIDGGDPLRSRAVVVASGARYRRPEIENLDKFEGRGVWYWASPVEARLCSGEEVALVGAGNSAGQAAVFLSGHAKKVLMIIRGGGLGASMSRYLIERIEATPNIELMFNTEISALEGDEASLLRRIPAPVRAPAPKATAPAPQSEAAARPASAAPAPVELSLADSVRLPKPTAPPLASRAPDPAAPKNPRAAPVPPEIDRLHAALRRSPIALHVQRLVPLNKGSQLKRYEVLLRSKSDDSPNSAPPAMLKAAVENGLGSMIDRRVVSELIGWLVHHPDVWQTKAVMFSVNLTSTALRDEHFIKFVDLCLAKSSLPKAMIGFEIDVATAMHLGDKAAEVAAALHRLGCPIVLDDFGLRTECFDLLRLPAVRYIKLASEITAKMRSDKLSQAAITAVVQMARVLGMHTVAKRTETAAEQEWLTALGVDFIQSNALSPPASIDSLSKQQKPKS
ncbi:MAG: EAL domain-containing protein, partial [Pseudomonadota bacterium]|nr:EAL domain-containing protein [Pseudomonadota bacterium]